MADATRNETHEHLAVARLCEVELLDDEWATELLQDCRANFQRSDLV